MKAFKFDMGQKVRLALSEEGGIVIGRAEYAEAADCYYVRYRASDGGQVEGWWNEQAINPA